MVLKNCLLLLLFNLFYLGLTGAGQENFHLLKFYDGTPTVLHLDDSFAVSVSVDDFVGVSTSVLKAESWLKSHVLAHFPALKFTTVLVGDGFLCQNGQNHNFDLILPALKNLYYSLTRWGMEREIKVSVAFDHNCFDHNSVLFQDEKFTKSLVQFLHSTNSTYTITLSSDFSSFSDKIRELVSLRTGIVRNIVSFEVNKINVIVENRNELMPMKRKLIRIPDRPKPLPGAADSSQPPLHSSIGFSVPANIAKNPHPPSGQVVSPPPLGQVVSPPPLPHPHVAAPPPMTFPFAPEQQPPAITVPPPMGGVVGGGPYGYLPPCNPTITAPISPAPAVGGGMQELWCVAKPSVPVDTLQEALDYACGDGGADCSEIMPHGNCFYPDTVFAHASYAFNSYYQKSKRNGGTCSFGGTAMLITSDPSFVHCKFQLS